MKANTATAIAVIVLAAAVCGLPAASFAVPCVAALATLARSLDGYVVVEAGLAPSQDLIESRVIPMCDDSLILDVKDSSGESFEVQIFYCNSRRPHNRLVYYLDTVQCLHGHYPHVEKASFALDGGGEAVRLDLEKDNARSTLVYWLQSAGKTSGDYFVHAAWLYRQDLAGRRSDGCFVKIAYYGQPSAERDEALAKLSRLVHDRIDEWLASAAKTE